jgi:hypothetical protein
MANQRVEGSNENQLGNGSFAVCPYDEVVVAVDSVPAQSPDGCLLRQIEGNDHWCLNRPPQRENYNYVLYPCQDPVQENTMLPCRSLISL